LAQKYGVAPSTVRTQVTRHLGKPKLPPRDKTRPAHLDKILDAIRLRNTRRQSWSIIADLVKYPSNGAALRVACVRYAKAAQVEVSAGMPRTRRTRWDTVTTKER
jgi:hypothetical protein